MDFGHLGVVSSATAMAAKLVQLEDKVLMEKWRRATEEDKKIDLWSFI